MVEESSTIKKAKLAKKGRKYKVEKLFEYKTLRIDEEAISSYKEAVVLWCIVELQNSKK